ncbi:MAG: site-specific integrase [Actinobacteria bacterium]|nr:site-specific integrase [Actinomycetota bacterium]
MPSGAAVLRREGVRGVVWSVKFLDADGRQVKERLGREADGWNRQRSERELGKRLDRVDRERWRKPQPLSFADFAERFLTEYLPGRNLKTSTLIDYRQVVRGHLVGFFDVDLAQLEAEPELIDHYIAAKTRERLSAKTIGNHLTTLSVMFRVAIRWRLARVNPVALVDRPRGLDREMQVLSEGEVAALLAAYRELEAGAEEAEREWWAIASRLTVVALGTALRRGELLGLRWGDVQLLERRLSVRQAFVRAEMTTPKSRMSRRTLDFGSRVADALNEQWAVSRYRADDSLVFGHPQLGTPLDPSKVTRDYLRPALKKAGIVKPFRPWHDMRHTALTHDAAAGNPQVYVQMRAGHSQGSITERYIHAAQVLFPGAADRAEARLFGEVAT